MIAVVSHHKEGVGGNGDRTEVVARSCLARNGVRVQMGAMGVVYGLAINIHFLVANLDRVARYGYDPFYKVFFGVFRKFEYHDIPSLGVLDRDKGAVRKWELYTVYKLIHQNMIPDQQGWLHGTGGDLECLHNKGTDEKCEDNSYEDRLPIFPEDVLFRLNRALG